MRIRGLAAILGVAAAALGACAPTAGPSAGAVGASAPGWPAGMTATPRPGTVAMASRLPARIGPFERVRAVSGDGLVGLSVQYAVPLRDGRLWATVFVNDHGDAPVADGLGSAPVAQDHALNLAAARGNSDGGAAIETTFGVADAPPQRCAVGTRRRGPGIVLNYACSTGVSGQILKVRATAEVPSAAQEDVRAVVGAVRRFVEEATRLAAAAPAGA